jgi:hypothetical protein
MVAVRVSKEHLEGSGQIWYRNVYLKPQDKSLDVPR